MCEPLSPADRMRAEADTFDQEELQELQPATEVVQTTQRVSRARAGFGRHCAREGTLEIVIPLLVICALALAAVVYNLRRMFQVEPCDETRPMAKHFYCYNRSMSPGVHVDTK